MRTALGLTKWLGRRCLSLLPCAVGTTRAGMSPVLGQSSSSSVFAGSVDFGPDVTSSDKSIKVLLNAQDKVSPAHVLWGKRVPQCPGGTGRMLSRAFPPISLSRERLGAARPRSAGWDGSGQRERRNIICRHSSAPVIGRVPVCRGVL